MRSIIKPLLAGGAVLGVGLPLTFTLAADVDVARTTPVDAAGDPVPLSLAEEVPDDAGSLLPDGVATTTGTLPGTDTSGSSTDSSTDGPDPGPDDAAPQLVGDHLLREVGQVAGLADDAGEPLVELVVTSIETAQTCPSRVDEQFDPVNGHFLVVEITAAMAEAAGADAENPEDVFLPLAADFFTVLGPDGAEQPGTLTDASWSCYTIDELVAPSLLPGETDSGYVVLDVASETGTLVYDPSGTGSGWAWEY
ncbi:hypothetical protein ACPYO6_15975 [Georgenia sp. Z1344]|uniref:hypothetical protein n=1 Tax=Georgenia sp. Z1344 TaxID=3416706 RepID=UPI003CE94610